MAYELFTRKRSHGGPPAITVTKNGMFVINSSALEKHIKPCQFVHVYYDKDAGKVGIKPLSKKVDKAYRLNVSPKGNVGTVSATSFLSFIGYDHKETINFPAEWNEREGLLEFTIKDSETKHPRRLPR
jgi:hypothetical protein